MGKCWKIVYWGIYLYILALLAKLEISTVIRCLSSICRALNAQIIIEYSKKYTSEEKSV